MRARGYTLLELLVTVAIISVLAAVLMPAGFPHHFRPRESTRRSACQSNLKQLAAAAEMYAADYDRRYPPAGLRCNDPAQRDGSAGCPAGALTYDGARYGSTETWQGGGLSVLQPYVRNTDVAWCPGQFPKWNADHTDPRSYYAGFEWLKSPERPRYPARKVLLMEAYSYHDGKYPRRFDALSNAKRRVNIAYVDGHVKYTDLSTGCSGSRHPDCAGWESCLGPGANGHYISSGFGKGIDVPDFP